MCFKPHDCLLRFVSSYDASRIKPLHMISVYIYHVQGGLSCNGLPFELLDAQCAIVYRLAFQVASLSRLGSSCAALRVALRVK